MPSSLPLFDRNHCATATATCAARSSHEHLLVTLKVRTTLVVAAAHQGIALYIRRDPIAAAEWFRRALAALPSQHCGAAAAAEGGDGMAAAWDGVLRMGK